MWGASAGLAGVVIKTGLMQGREDAQRGYLDVEALAGELLAPGSVFAFLARQRGRLFPDASTLTYWRRRLAGSGNPHRIMEAIG